MTSRETPGNTISLIELPNAFAVFSISVAVKPSVEQKKKAKMMKMNFEFFSEFSLFENIIMHVFFSSLSSSSTLLPYQLTAKQQRFCHIFVEITKAKVLL